MLRNAVFVLLLYPCGLSEPSDVQMRDRPAQSHAADGSRDPRVPDPPPASDPIDSDGDGTPD